MMIAQPRIQHHQHQHQHQQPPAPLVSFAVRRSSAAPPRGRSLSRRNRLPPFLVAAAMGASSSSSSSLSEDPAATAIEDMQQQPKARSRRRKSSRPTAQPGQQQQQGQLASSSTPRILRRLSHSLIRRRHHHRRDGSRTTSRPSAASLSSSTEPNVVDFLQQACPREVLPLVLAYAGPHVSQALAHSNTFWNELMKDEATWKVQCQELYKWNNQVEEPASWKELYMSSPCVPIDYPTIDRALAAVPNPVTLWLRPGQECVLQRPITVTTDMKICVMAVPVVARFRAGGRHPANSRSSRGDPSHRAKALSSDHHNHHPDVDGVDETWRSSDDSSDDEEWAAPTASARTNDIPEQALPRTVVATSISASSNRALVGASTLRPCTLILHTRQMNSPVIWVQSGCLTLDRVVLSHACLGVDIWNGNAALQVQPPAAAAATTAAQRSPALPPSLPRAVLTRCQVTSQSGRGIVVMDGGRVTIQKSSVLDCAATGVYIGGPHSPVAPAEAAAPPAERRRSRAELVDSKVSGNGIGSYYREALAAASGVGGPRGLLRANRLPRRPSVIARGHSGVYLEQGDCHISSSVIRSNALTGISAVSEQARLVVTGSTLDSNGSQQLETVPSRFVRLENNRIVDVPPPPLHHRHPGAWDPRNRQDVEDLDDLVRMVMDQP